MTPYKWIRHFLLLSDEDSRMALAGSLPTEEWFQSTRKQGTSYMSASSKPGKRHHSISSSTFQPPSVSRLLPMDEDDSVKVFSDEYDLSQEDSRILQDVERAVKMKARREARMKAGKSSQSSTTTRTSPTSATFPPSSPTRKGFSSATDSPANTTPSSPPVEVDFSPSTNDRPAPLSKRLLTHPVPWSPDDGATLDWSGYADDDKSERRWTLSISKSSKGKEREHIMSLMTLEKQESLYSSKLSRIRTMASPQTMQKAAITVDQLQRRYQLLYTSLSKNPKRYDLVKVARWYDNQDTIVQSALTKAEPLTWLKHLEKRVSSSPKRSPWHLSALVMEEFLQAHRTQDSMDPIPEEYASPNLSALSSPYVSASVPTFHSPSLNGSRFSFAQPLSRRISAEGRISFEPLVESRRQSLESRHSVDSAPNSVVSGPSVQMPHPHIPPVASPTGSRVHLRDGIRRRGGDGSDSAASPRNSLYEQHSDDNADRSNSLKAGDAIERQRSQDSGNGVQSGDESQLRRSPLVVESAQQRFILGASPTSKPTSLKSEKGLAVPRNPYSPNRPQVRISLPPPERVPEEPDRLQQEEEDDAQADYEYELKAQLLEQCRAQNSRVRGLLNRIATGVKEYETCQASLMSSLGLAFKGLPSELIEAFVHDPAAVTGHTRRYRGYKAVDDIHNRLARQRAIFHSFLQNDAGEGGFPVTDDILRDPISALLQSIGQLEAHHDGIATKVKEASSLLEETQAIHNQVKDDFHGALSHTAAVYPEISQIQLLEENYRDRYAHIWELGMNGLTFVLDSVTPFWRTYGRTIGIDVQDFLIIPLYRNEFTGEAKRYPITRLPKRSFRHWVALVLFFCGWIGLTGVQAYLGLASLSRYRLHSIESDGLRWMALPIFWGTIIAQWILVFVSLSIVLLQAATVCWWLGWSVRLFK
ncbi:hypothetical protein AAF712_000649 [Marasmius tenuissimus]|uniref:Uncharacterized protein n=1 Tax=Marasmius tenuissimus TaxID=585030 RepID=A0ABR3AGM1_9AGAR